MSDRSVQLDEKLTTDTSKRIDEDGSGSSINFVALGDDGPTSLERESTALMCASNILGFVEYHMVRPQKS